MRCFYHPAAEAVGICKHCSRALCSECAGTRAGSLACPNRCETFVDAVDALVSRNVRLSRGTSPISWLAVLVYFGAAIAFAILFYRETNLNLRVLLGAMTAIMLLAGIANTRVLLSRIRNRN